MRETRAYSSSFKEMAVQKLLSQNSEGLTKTAKKIGISASTLFDWKKKYGNSIRMSDEKKSKKPKNWTPEKKLQAIIETSAMSEHELGEYLRINGIHSSLLEEWKQDALGGFKTRGRPKKDPEVTELRKDNKVLQKDLKRKEKALAEMSARVILLKKSHEIFGDEEDDE